MILKLQQTRLAPAGRSPNAGAGLGIQGLRAIPASSAKWPRH